MVGRMDLQAGFKRVTNVLVWTTGGVLGGGIAGLIIGIKEGRSQVDPSMLSEEDRHFAKIKHLLGRAESLRSFRGMLGPVVNGLAGMLTNQEFELKLELERLGYYPCSRCGKRHPNAGPHATCLPMGSFWDEGSQDYVEFGDERWTPEGYQQATGEPWTGPRPAEEPPEEDEEPPLH